MTQNAWNTTALTTNGQLLIGSTGTRPVAATLTGGTGISVVNGAGSITLSATGAEGPVLQQVRVTSGAVTTITNVALGNAAGTAIPTATGVTVLSVSITPANVNSVLVFNFSFLFGRQFNTSLAVVALFQTGIANALYAVAPIPTNDLSVLCTGQYYTVAGTTLPTTYFIQVAPNVASPLISVYFNSTNGVSITLGGTQVGTLMITEYSA